MNDLEKARLIINDVDSQMRSLFERRMEAVKMVANYKKERGMQIFDPVREEQVILKNSAQLENEDLKSYYISFLRSNMEISRSFQHRLLDGMKVAFSGVEGAFANIAAKRAFPDAVPVAYKSFTAAYESVVNGECDCAILPLENSNNGDVGQVMDLAFFGNLYINGIYDLSVTQNLVAIEGTSIGQIKTVISHPQALGQCAQFIEEHGFDTIECVNTAIAAKQVAESGRHDIAAIASEEAAKLYGLVKLESHINSDEQNTTRFAVFSKVPRNTTNDSQFVLCFTVRNEAGALGQAITVIGKHGFNLRALKSRPSQNLIWSYFFFAEGEGNINSENGQQMLKELEKCCSHLHVVGSYDTEIDL